MIKKVREGRAAWSITRPHAKPETLCPYQVPMSMEQLAWLLGYTKAQKEYLEEKISQYSQEDNVLMATNIKNAQLQAEHDWKPNVNPVTVCPFMGNHLVIAYVMAWRKKDLNQEPITEE